LLPFAANWCIRARDAAVNAVSDPENKPDSNNRIAMPLIVASVVISIGFEFYKYLSVLKN
tara:strand:+ start:114 stop:293 length:180 start_codon:yes stop_codon:yes gene_type:complete